VIKRLIVLLVICATHGIIHAQLSVYNNEQAITQNNLGIEYCLDSSVIIDNQLPKKLYPFHTPSLWQRKPLASLYLQNLSTPLWLKIPIDSISRYHSFDYLQIANSHINFLNCWIVKNDSVLKTFQQTGDNTPFYTRAIPHNEFVFPIHDSDYQHGYIILAIDKQFTSIEVPLYFFSLEKFASFNQEVNVLFGIIFGLGVLFILIHTLLYIVIRDPVYLWYSIFQAFLFLFISIEHGYLFTYLYPKYFFFNDVIRPFSLVVLVAPLFVFFNEILNLRQHSPKLFRFNLWLVFFYVILLAFSVIRNLNGSFEVKGFWLQVGTILTPAMNIFLLGQTIFCVIKRIRFARFLLISILGNNILAIIYILTQRQLLPPNFFFSNSMYFSFLWEMAIMSFVLVSRYSYYKQEAEQLVVKIRHQQENVYKIIADNQEKEMQRISSLLHDSVGANLGLLRLDIENMNLSEEGRNQVANKIAYIGNDIRKLSHSLSPILLQEKGLYASIDEWIQQINASSNLTIQYEWIGQSLHTIDRHEVIAFRIVQEMIHNIIKHSKATHAFLQIIVADYIISIYAEDNGIGIGTEEIEKGVGLKNIEKMMDILGGRYTIESAIGKGFSISVEFNYQINESV
jgi:signal transduction histidine kinase